MSIKMVEFDFQAGHFFTFLILVEKNRRKKWNNVRKCYKLLPKKSLKNLARAFKGTVQRDGSGRM